MPWKVKHDGKIASHPVYHYEYPMKAPIISHNKCLSLAFKYLRVLVQLS